MSSSSTRPHILAVPFYLPGHEIPLLHLCQHLISFGNCRVSVLQAPLSKSFAPNKSPSLFSSPFLTLHTLPEHLLPNISNLNMQDFKRFHDAFEGLGDAVVEAWKGQQLTCIITDVFVNWGKYIAEQLSIPWVAFWTSTTTELAVYFNIPRSISSSCIKGSESFVSSLSIPGLPEIKASDYSTIEYYQDPDFHVKFLVHGFVRKVGLTVDADRVLVNTALALEGNAVESLKRSGVNVVPVGPLHLLSEHQDESDHHADDPNKVLPWLDLQRDASVLFIAFGTTVPMPPGQIQEFASALESLEDLRFVWVLRTPEYIEQVPSSFTSVARFRMRAKELNASESLENGIHEVTHHRGLVTDWVPQRKVLKHRGVSGFLTHCGWNSVLESITSGMPMITRPFIADQLLTSTLLEEWGVCVRIQGVMSPTKAVGKKEIEEAIEEYRLNVGALKKRTGELGALVNRETELGRGASSLNLDSFVKDLQLWS